VDLLTVCGAAASRSEATRLIRGGGIYVNARRVADEKERLLPDQATGGQLFVIRRGKKEHFLVRIVRGMSSPG
jgi:tyrosyl-tRNA synthetase